MARTKSYRYAPDDCIEFQQLCAALVRGDATVTRVDTWRTQTPYAYGLRLGTALRHNSVVQEISINLSYFLSKTDQEAHTTLDAELLLHWLRHTTSLRLVQFHFWINSRGRGSLRAVEILLLDRILHTLTMNPSSIHVLESYMHDFPLPLLTGFLTAPLTRLRALRVKVNDEASPEHTATAAAQAIGAQLTLEKLTLQVNDVRPFLECLASHPALRELTINARYRPCLVSDMSLLSNAMRSCPKFCQLTLEKMNLDAEKWSLIVTNPSLSGLQFSYCTLAPETAGLMWRMVQSNTSTTQHVRSLELHSCTLMGGASLLVHALRGSLLEHLTLDESSVPQMKQLFRILTRNPSDIRLCSLQLNHTSVSVWRDVARYLVTTATLRRLTMTVHAERRPLSMPRLFWSSVRANGSLVYIDVACADAYGRERLRVGQNFFEAIATRNKLVPPLLQTLNSSHSNGMSTHDGSQFPTFCLVAQQAPRVAPHWMFLGLLAASSALCPTMDKGKRVGRLNSDRSDIVADGADMQSAE